MPLIQLINILANSGLYFVLPLAGSTLAAAPSIEGALWTMFLGLILSASREGIDYVRQQERKKHG